MSVRRIEITVSEETWAALNVARGHEPRASFVKRALESALGERPSAGLPAKPREVAGSTPVTPAPSQASVPQVPGVVRASSLSKEGVKPRPKLK